VETKGIENAETREFKDAILAEIVKAYRESGKVYQKTTNPEVRQAVLELKRCYDLAIDHLLPPGMPAEELWEELNARFSE